MFKGAAIFAVGIASGITIGVIFGAAIVFSAMDAQNKQTITQPPQKETTG